MIKIFIFVVRLRSKNVQTRNSIPCRRLYRSRGMQEKYLEFHMTKLIHFKLSAYFQQSTGVDEDKAVADLMKEMAEVEASGINANLQQPLSNIEESFKVIHTLQGGASPVDPPKEGAKAGSKGKKADAKNPNQEKIDAATKTIDDNIRLVGQQLQNNLSGIPLQGKNKEKAQAVLNGLTETFIKLAGSLTKGFQGQSTEVVKNSQNLFSYTAKYFGSITECFGVAAKGTKTN